jgi:hypothetical protein
MTPPSLPCQRQGDHYRENTMMDPDPRAAFGLFWHEGRVIHEQTHVGRALQIIENKHPEEQPASFLCSISFEGRHEGFLTLSPSGTAPRLHGFLVRGMDDSFIVRLDSFTYTEGC